MIKTLWRKFKRKKRKKQRKEKRLKTIEEKRFAWTKKWGSNDFDPAWNLKAFPVSIRELIDNKTIPKGVALVDIGCGSGYLSAKLSEEGFHVSAFDFAETAIERARQQYQETSDLKFYVADATSQLPFKGTFKIGIDRGALHTLPLKNRRDYVLNISPIIEAGGKLIIIYAKQIARKLIESSKDDPSIALKDHFIKLFDGVFEIDVFKDVLIDTHRKEDRPGYLVILRRL